jgi:hypothetical protein
MRRCAIICLLVICGALVLSAGLAGCGGGSNSNPVIPAGLKLTPSTISIDQGGSFQLIAIVTNSAGVPITQNVTYTSSAASVATVSSGGTATGLVCGGTWDSLTTPVVCSPGSVGSATITATVGSLTATTTVYVHQHITSVTLAPSSVNCDHQMSATLMTATAFNNATDITSTVGPFNWTSNDTNVVTVIPNTAIPNLLNLGTATAVNSGQTTLFASVSGTNSTPTTFVTCPVVSISAHVTGSTATSFSVAVGATQSLTADLVDSTGQAVNANVTWTSSSPPTASVTGSGTTGVGTVTGVAAGTASITASCTPPNCNNGLNSPVYSNPVSATVTGALGAQTVYATSSQLNVACGTASSGTCSSIVPIAVGTTTAGTSVALPSNEVPNSLVFNGTGSTAYMGTPQGLLILSTSNNTVAGAVTNAVGKVLAVSPDGNLVIISNPGVNVTVFNSSNNTVQTLSIANAAAAAFTPDSFKAYIVGGSTLYVYSPNFALRTIALAGAVNDVAFLSNGSFGYLAGGGSGVTVHATCDNSQQDAIATAATPTFIRKVPATLQMAAVDSPNLEIITAVPTNPPPPACPPTLTDALTTVAVGALTPNALIITPDGTRALITSNLAEVTQVNLATNAVTHIPLSGGAHAFTGGVTRDSNVLFVGCSDGAVHSVDLRIPADSVTIPISFPNQAAGVPVDLVAVRP